MRTALALSLIAAATLAAAQSAPTTPGQSLPATPAAGPAPAPVWQLQESGTTASLRGIHAVSAQVAWASGSEGTVLRTTDGGAHWQRCATPDAAKDGATLDFRGVQAWNADTAIVMASGPGDKSRLYKTTDGCATWSLVFKNPDSPDGFFDGIHFPREQRTVTDHEGFGLLLGDPVRNGFAVFETRDGGHSWKRLADDLLSVKGTSAAAFAASNGCITGMGGATFSFGSGGAEGSYLLRVNYSGDYFWLNDGPAVTRTWAKVAVPIRKGSESAGIFAVNGHVVVEYNSEKTKLLRFQFLMVAVGGDYTMPNESAGTAAWSLDGGAHWTAAAKPPHGYRSTVQWSEDLKLWIAAGTNGSDLSRDDGRTWEPLDDGNWNALSLPFIVGPKGRIARLNPAGVPAPSGAPAR